MRGERALPSAERIDYAIDPKKLDALKNLILYTTDILWLFLSVSIVYVLYLNKGLPPGETYLSLFVFYTAYISIVYYIFDVNDLRSHISDLYVPGRVLLLSAVNILVLSGLFYFLPDSFLNRLQLGRVVFVGTLVLAGILSSFTRFFLSRLYRNLYKAVNVALLSMSTNTENLLREFKSLEARCYSLSHDQFNKETMKRNKIQVLILCPHETYTSDLVEKIINFRLAGGSIYTTYEYAETFLKKIPIDALKGEFFAFANGFPLVKSKIRNRVKRAMDIGISLFLGILSLPLCIIVAVLIKLTSRGPVLFTQLRTGINGKDFYLYKFRSMKNDAEKDGAQWSKENDPRITWFGKILRKTRIDEIPQFINIFQGDMSLVGPRPERPEFNEILEKEIPFYNLRHTIRPGVTGWAQIFYPYGASVEDSVKKFEYELYYIKNFDILMDFSVILKTIKTLIMGKGR